jgi:hypothetical protein
MVVLSLAGTTSLKMGLFVAAEFHVIAAPPRKKETA